MRLSRRGLTYALLAGLACPPFCFVAGFCLGKKDAYMLTYQYHERTKLDERIMELSDEAPAVAEKVKHIENYIKPADQLRYFDELRREEGDMRLLAGMMQAAGTDMTNQQDVQQRRGQLIFKYDLPPDAAPELIARQIAEQKRFEVFSNQWSLATFFVGRVAYYATEEERYKRETLDMMRSYPKIEQFFREHNRFPNPPERDALTRDKYSAIPEPPPSANNPYKDAISIERREYPGGSTERVITSPGLTDAERNKRILEKRQEAINDGNRQRFEDSKKRLQEDVNRAWKNLRERQKK
jgi:hypothetical protein